MLRKHVELNTLIQTRYDQSARARPLAAAAVERKAHADHRLDGDPLVLTMRRSKDKTLAQLDGDRSVLVVSYNDNLRILEALIDEAPRCRDPWPAGMALDYRFDTAGRVVSKDAMQERGDLGK